MTHRPTSAETAAAVTELHTLRTALTDLAQWAAGRLDEDYRDRQYIAEHLTETLFALLNGDTPPEYPF